MAQPGNKRGSISFKDFRIEQIFKPIAILIPIAIAINVIYILITSKPHILKNLIDIHLGYLLIAAMLAFVPWFAHSARLILWSRVFGRGLKPTQALRTAVATDLGSAVTPSSTGGGYFKLGFLIGYGFAPGEATLLTFLGSIEDAIFFAITLPLAIIYSRAWNDPYIKIAVNNLASHWPYAAAIAIVLIITYFSIIRRKSKRRQMDYSEGTKRPHLIERVRQGIHEYGTQFIIALKFAVRNGKSTLGFCTLLSGLGWCCRYGAVSALVIGLGFHANFILFFILQWVIFSTMILIPTPGAVGGAEVTFALVFSGTVPPAILPILVGAWRFVTFYMLVGLGAMFMAITGAGPTISPTKGKDEQVLQEVKA
jgi:glycosyltransferase 2 family protein